MKKGIAQKPPKSKGQNLAYLENNLLNQDQLNSQNKELSLLKNINIQSSTSNVVNEQEQTTQSLKSFKKSKIKTITTNSKKVVQHQSLNNIDIDKTAEKQKSEEENFKLKEGSKTTLQEKQKQKHNSAQLQQNDLKQTQNNIQQQQFNQIFEDKCKINVEQEQHQEELTSESAQETKIILQSCKIKERGKNKEKIKQGVKLKIQKESQSYPNQQEAYEEFQLKDDTKKVKKSKNQKHEKQKEAQINDISFKSNQKLIGKENLEYNQNLQNYVKPPIEKDSNIQQTDNIPAQMTKDIKTIKDKDFKIANNNEKQMNEKVNHLNQQNEKLRDENSSLRKTNENLQIEKQGLQKSLDSKSNFKEQDRITTLEQKLQTSHKQFLKLQEQFQYTKESQKILEKQIQVLSDFMAEQDIELQNFLKQKSQS